METELIVTNILTFIALYFEVFLILTLFSDKKTLAEKKISKRLKTVTIIVPVFNEEKTVCGTIDSLLNLDYPKNLLKIILVDDGSQDKTFEVVQKYKENPQIEIYSKENGGKHTAVNLGISKTDSELIGCLDADSFVEKNALKIISGYFEDEEIMAVTPAIKIYEPKSFLGHLQSNEYNFGIFNRKAFSVIDGLTVTPGPFSIFRKKVFDELGGFKKAHNTEDMEIAFRMQKNHYKIKNAHNAVTYTVGPQTLKALYKQRIRWAYGFLKNLIDYKFMIMNKQYGALGMLVLPVAIMSFVAAVFFAGKIILFLIDLVLRKIIEIKTIGFQFYGFNFDWFFLNTSSVVFLGMVMITMTIILMIAGTKLSEDKIKLSPHMLYFPFVYPFIAILWILRALFNVSIGKMSNWR